MIPAIPNSYIVTLYILDPLFDRVVWPFISFCSFTVNVVCLFWGCWLNLDSEGEYLPRDLISISMFFAFTNYYKSVQVYSYRYWAYHRSYCIGLCITIKRLPIKINTPNELNEQDLIVLSDFKIRKKSKEKCSRKTVTCRHARNANGFCVETVTTQCCNDDTLDWITCRQ